MIFLHILSKVFICSSFGLVALISFQESPDGEQSSMPKTEKSGSGDGGLSAPSGSSSKGGAPSVSFASLPSKPLVKLDPQSPPAPAPAPAPAQSSNPSVSSNLLSYGDRAIRRPPSPMEALMGSPRKQGDGGTRSSSKLTSSDLLRGPKPYTQWDVTIKKRWYCW